MARRKSQRRQNQAFQQLPWRQPRVPFPPLTLLSEDEVERIHDASLSVLEDIGMDFPNRPACD